MFIHCSFLRIMLGQIIPTKKRHYEMFKNTSAKGNANNLSYRTD